MALTGLHTNWLNGSYTNDRDYQIKLRENPWLLGRNLTWLNAHVDRIGNSVAVGYGYDLRRNLRNLRAALANYVTQDSDLDAVFRLVDNYFNRGNRDGYRPLAALVTAINDNFDFGTEANASDLLAQTVNNFETQLDRRLGYPMAQSRERAALVSMAYNGGIGLIGNSLRDAIVNDNRAEAWFEIRYQSNGGRSQSPGIANRRYFESDLFGLYDSGSPPIADADEAKEVYRMFTSHRRSIMNYEMTYRPASPIESELQPAKAALFDYLQTKYADDRALLDKLQPSAFRSVDIYLNPAGENDANRDSFMVVSPSSDLRNSLVIGWDQRDVMRGDNGTDVMIGGAGDDYLTGEGGNDFLFGGAGNDTYFINTGDGTDTIEDKEGTDNRVIFNGKPLVRFYESPGGQTLEYTSADRLFSGSSRGTDFVVTEIASGTSVILNEDFQEGDFGIHFYDALTPSDNPVTTNVIPGDQNPQKPE